MIKTDVDHKLALARVEEIFDSEPGSSEFEELEGLVARICAYEDIHHPIQDPSPAELADFLEDKKRIELEHAEQCGVASGEVLTVRSLG